MPRSAAMSGAFTSFTVSSTRPWKTPFSVATVSSLVSCSESGPWTAIVTREGHAPASAIARRPSFAASGTNGPSTSSSRGSTTGMFTAVRTTSPSSAAATCSAMTTPARSCASVVEPARCGVTTTCGQLQQRPGVRLLLEDVERCAGHLPRADRLGERGLVDEPASGCVHDAARRPSSARRRRRRGGAASRRSAGGGA